MYDFAQTQYSMNYIQIAMQDTYIWLRILACCEFLFTWEYFDSFKQKYWNND